SSRIIPLVTLGTSIWELAPAAPSAETNDPMGTVWSTPVNVVAAETIPTTAPAVGICMETLTARLFPIGGLRRYHLSTRRVAPASLWDPRILNPVPLYVIPTTPVVGELAMFIATLTIRSRFTPPAVVVWVKLLVTVPAPVRSLAMELVLSTATCALPKVAANTTSSPRMIGDTRASFRSRFA